MYTYNIILSQDVGINIISVNIHTIGLTTLEKEKEVHYQHIQIEFELAGDNCEKELLEELSATGMVIEAKTFPAENKKGLKQINNY